VRPAEGISENQAFILDLQRADDFIPDIKSGLSHDDKSNTEVLTSATDAHPDVVMGR